MTGEFVKNLTDDWKIILTQVSNDLWVKGEIPEGWKKARIFPIYKAGGADIPGNYRGVYPC